MTPEPKKRCRFCQRGIGRGRQMAGMDFCSKQCEQIYYEKGYDKEDANDSEI